MSGGGGSAPRAEGDGGSPGPSRSPRGPADVVQRLQAQREREWRALQRARAAAPAPGVSRSHVLAGLVGLALLVLLAWWRLEGVPLIAAALLLEGTAGIGVVWLLSRLEFPWASVVRLYVAGVSGLSLAAGLVLLLAW